MIVLLYWHREHPPLKRLITADRVHDLGNLLLVSMVLWAYVSFFQFLVIWMGNTQEEIVYVHQRSVGIWRFVTAALMLFNFAVPFIGLLAQNMKRDLRKLASIAAGMLMMQLIYVVWVIEPTSYGDTPAGWNWADFVVVPLVLIGWGALAVTLIGQASPVVIYQPESEIKAEVEHGAQLAAD